MVKDRDEVALVDVIMFRLAGPTALERAPTRQRLSDPKEKRNWHVGSVTDGGAFMSDSFPAMG
jgi:hypothetical protein